MVTIGTKIGNDSRHCKAAISFRLDDASNSLVDLASTFKVLRSSLRVWVHLSIESDRDRLPGLPPPASSVAQRLEAARALHAAGLRVVVTVSPLLPIEHPARFFAALADAADAVVIDHWVEGDGSPDGSRTARTPLPAAVAALDPEATGLAYRDRMVEIARKQLPGRVGVSRAGFAGRYA